MEQRNQKQPNRTEPEPFRVRLPGFLVREEIGLGDAIKHVTYAVGIKLVVGVRSERRL